MSNPILCAKEEYENSHLEVAGRDKLLQKNIDSDDKSEWRGGVKKNPEAFLFDLRN